MNEAARICARLIREATVPRNSVPEIAHPEIRREVERRLADVGLVLATSAYSDHIGLRLHPDVASDGAFDAASNLGLRADECALLVIAWARLGLQKRTARDTRDLPGPQSLLPEARAEAARSFQPHVRVSTLAREFKGVLGSASSVKRLVTRLRNLRFLAGRGDIVEPGPLLELALDGERLVGWIRRNVLAQLLEEKAQSEEPEESPDGLPARVLRALADLGGQASMRQLRQATSEPVSRLRAALRTLEAEGKVDREGHRSKTLYRRVT